MSTCDSHFITIITCFSPILTTHTQGENRDKVIMKTSRGFLGGHDGSQHTARFSFVMWPQVRIVIMKTSQGVMKVHASNLILKQGENQHRGENHG